ncbi:MAG: hypothetical protein HQL60_00435 [Magnetococcales bacterium]|nr:hypothetical protein [Magnetococcales bacterium]
MAAEAPVAVRLLLLVLLPLLAAVLYGRGQHYDSTLLDFKSARNPVTVLLPHQAGDWQRQAEVRLFGKDNLYEYINGHAEYFLGAGFRSLVVAEYRLPTDTRPSVVADVYDMGEAINAFGVLMEEMGPTGQSVDIGETGLQSQRSLGFTSGPYYVKLAAFADHLPLSTLAQTINKALFKTAGPAQGRISWQGLFPDLGTVTSSRFIKENYQGWSFLQRVVERSFIRADGTVIRAFSVSGTAEQMAAVQQALLTFMRQEENKVTDTQVDGMRILQITDRYEGDWILLPVNKGWLGVFHPLDSLLQQQLKAFMSSHG